MWNSCVNSPSLRRTRNIPIIAPAHNTGQDPIMIKATNGLTRRAVLAGGAALGLPGGLRSAAAADPVDLEAAKREGKVTLYTSAPIAAAQKFATAFEQKFGIKVELF